MFYAPVICLPVQRVVLTTCAYLRELLKVRHTGFDPTSGYYWPDAVLRPNGDAVPLLLKKEATCHLKI